MNDKGKQMEIWKKVIDYQDIYEISNLGNLKNIKTNKIITKTKNGSGYLLVGLIKNSKIKTFRFHRLLAIHFILNPNNLPYVNHKDSNKLNYNLNNLEWVTHRENVSHGALSKNKTSKYPGISWSKTINKWYAQIQINKKTINIGNFLSEDEAYTAYKQYLINNNITHKYVRN